MTVDDFPLPPRIDQAIDRLGRLQRNVVAHPSMQEPRDAPGEQLAHRLAATISAMRSLDANYDQEGRELMLFLQSHFPDLWPLVERELLWFFGGDCLHFLSDEEIDAFQRAEDA